MNEWQFDEIEITYMYTGWRGHPGTFGQKAESQ